VPIQRGLVYATPSSSAGTIATVVLTNDLWNRKMGVYGLVRLVQPALRETVITPVLDVNGQALQALPSQLVLGHNRFLGEAVAALDQPTLDRVEGGLVEALGLLRLLSTPAALPPTPAGSFTYPEWAGVYYATTLRVDDEAKRYVVVSTNRENARCPTVLVVRTTSRTKQPTEGIAFPAIEDGSKHACCGDLTSVLKSTLPLQRSFQPQRLSFNDTQSVAQGLVQTHQLGEALARRLI
jgi:hypothetical protein